MMPKKTMWLLGAVLFLLAAGLLLYPVVHHLVRVDPCLDGGGCWDRIDDVCRTVEVNAQELCNRAAQKTGGAHRTPTR